MPPMPMVHPERSYLDLVLCVLEDVPGVPDWMPRALKRLGRERLEFAASALPIERSGLTPGGVPFELGFSSQSPGLRFLIDLSGASQAEELLSATCADAGIAAHIPGLDQFCAGVSLRSPLYAAVGDGLRLYRSVATGGFARVRQLAAAASFSGALEQMLDRLAPLAGQLRPMFLGTHFGAGDKRSLKLYVRGVSQFEMFRQLVRHCDLEPFGTSFALFGRHLLPGLPRLLSSAYLIEIDSDQDGNLGVKVDFSTQRHQLGDAEVRARIQTWSGARMPEAYGIVLDRLANTVAPQDPLSLHTVVGFGISAATGPRLNAYIRPRFAGPGHDVVAAFLRAVVRKSGLTGQRIRETAAGRGLTTTELDVVREDAGWALRANLRDAGVLRVSAVLDAHAAIEAAIAMRAGRDLAFSSAHGRLVLTFEPHRGAEDRAAEVESMMHELLADTADRRDL